MRFFLILILIFTSTSVKGSAQTFRTTAPSYSHSCKITNSCDAIVFTNKCYDDVNLAIRYQDPDGSWVTTAWHLLNGATTSSNGSNFTGKIVAHTKNRIFYYYAESKNGKHEWSGDDIYNSIRGSDTKYGFKKQKITTSEWGSWQVSLTCN